MTIDEKWRQAISDPLATAEGPWLTGKVAAIAGGGLSGPEGGVGFGIAWLCARSGANVAVLDRDREAGERAVELIRELGVDAEWIELDIMDDASCQTAVAAAKERFGRIDVVADSIGGGSVESILTVSEEEFDATMTLNFKSAWMLIKHVAPAMEDGGAIVTVSSGATEGRGPGMAYTFAKHALEKLTIGASQTLASRRIRVNCVRVGMIWGAFAAKGMTEDRRELRRKSVAMQIEGNSWDIASAGFFLLTEQARWVSGQVFSVDGGGMSAAARGNVGSAGSPDPGKGE
ncbi:oxidoreductase [Pseudoclavibacter endophyticus]|uniref:SDR family NAD(P)-dependent oxidoreductase n=1 Tax=Pseudoclavibacter endophyticus TaxID=1778590 RepID=UPI0016692625|nr:SDR family oxidoreductase [Pseudoclavibacter endophyticus]GGA61016.1 oxidoreductase [Pseudoclavibacter endophyticus]